MNKIRVVEIPDDNGGGLMRVTIVDSDWPYALVITESGRKFWVNGASIMLVYGEDWKEP